ncbi:unnamed protein product [Protopolystoma xenopodis]|uniref:Uncharacterized protein n=1 Tax=Protopolystoma xenopodis TaxID=117903 RepID=A0A3S5C1L9_9PLAT|nr:unnamed protein product [Protopolystoma xenopodis]
MICKIRSVETLDTHISCSEDNCTDHSLHSIHISHDIGPLDAFTAQLSSCQTQTELFIPPVLNLWARCEAGIQTQPLLQRLDNDKGKCMDEPSCVDSCTQTEYVKKFGIAVAEACSSHDESCRDSSQWQEMERDMMKSYENKHSFAKKDSHIETPSYVIECKANQVGYKAKLKWFLTIFFEIVTI